MSQLNTAPPRPANALTTRWRAPYLRAMLDLKIGQAVDLYPEAGDTLDALWTRVKKQATRYKLAGRYFHLHKRRDHIFVQRMEKGQRGKLAPLLQLKVGQKLRCSDPFVSDQEKKNLRRRLIYLLEQGLFIWIEQHDDRSLYYRCAAKYETRGSVWSEQPADDGSDFRGARVVCCPSRLRLSQSESEKIKAAIMTNRADADAVADKCTT